jgi:hypothetical protein
MGCVTGAFLPAAKKLRDSLGLFPGDGLDRYFANDATGTILNFDLIGTEHFLVPLWAATARFRWPEYRPALPGYKAKVGENYFIGRKTGQRNSL